jgi:hypothetical protein
VLWVVWVIFFIEIHPRYSTSWVESSIWPKRGEEKNPKQSHEEGKQKPISRGSGQGRPKRIDPIKSNEWTQISQIVIDFHFLLFFSFLIRPFPAFQIISPEMFSF